MKLLYIVRHAKAQHDAETSKDFDRALTEFGKIDAQAMAQYLFSHSDMPDILLSSSAKRALQTAEIFAEVYKINKDKILKQKNIYDALDTRDLILIVKAIPDTAQIVFLFGHNPSVTALANFCTSDQLHELPTCAIARIELDADTWSAFDNKTATWTNFWVPKSV